ncbi:MAG: hypothetical protein IPH06_10045 [Alphaproteobacteria bacterium]|jgi:hypothetical protein|nr:hypothetical protein [Alphaproteobacteria bacterium]QQS58330.1 MAG: hypothetical protein IPN28_05800 [Alphaproteobacteria bacterium]
MYTRLRGHDNETGEPEIVVPAVFQKKLCGLFAPAVKNCNAQKMDSGLRRNDGGVTTTADRFAPSRFKMTRSRLRS